MEKVLFRRIRLPMMRFGMGSVLTLDSSNNLLVWKKHAVDEQLSRYHLQENIYDQGHAKLRLETPSFLRPSDLCEHS